MQLRRGVANRANSLYSQVGRALDAGRPGLRHAVRLRCLPGREGVEEAEPVGAAAASPRLVTPSLARMLDTCTLAVLAEMNSSLAISRLLRPAATSRRTSNSRAVRPSRSGSDAMAWPSSSGPSGILAQIGRASCRERVEVAVGW